VCADDEDGAIAELRSVAVLARMQLHDAGIEFLREPGDPRPLMARHRDHHVVRLEAPRPADDDGPVAVARHPIDSHACPDWKIELRGVGLKVIGDVVLRGQHAGRRRERHARQSVVPRGREQPQRVPAVAPGVADVVVGVKDHARQIALREVVADSQAGLTPPTTTVSTC
jgi:hypothetical protein